MKRILFISIFTASLFFASEARGQSDAQSRTEGSRIVSETVTLRRGEQFRRRAAGRVEVIDIATGRTNLEVECFCDSDQGPAGSCEPKIVGDKVECKSVSCNDCDMYKVGGFKGDDKLQTESPTTGAALRPPSGATDETQKWTITPNPSLKGTPGRMTVNLPPGTKYVVQVFKSGSRERAASESGFKSASLLPGLYDVIINTGGSDAAQLWRVRGIPVESGKDTRLHAGVLNVTVDGIWNVYDESRDVMIVGGNGPAKIGLLAGSYQVKLGNAFTSIVIRDGQVTDF